MWLGGHVWVRWMCMLKDKELDQECTGEKGGAEKREQRIWGEHKKPGLRDLLHQAVWLPIHTPPSPGSAWPSQSSLRATWWCVGERWVSGVLENALKWMVKEVEGRKCRTWVDWLWDSGGQRKNAQPTEWWLNRSKWQRIQREEWEREAVVISRKPPLRKENMREGEDWPLPCVQAWASRRPLSPQLSVEHASCRVWS